MDIQTYLTSLSEQLNLSPSETQKILREIKSHLVQETASLEKTGLSRIKAEDRACAEFGDPAVIAQGYQKMSSWFFRTSLRVVILSLVVMAIVNEIPNWLFHIFGVPFSVTWLNITILAPHLFFAAVVFGVVQKLTFSPKRLWRLLAVTLLTIYFGEILYDLSRIIIGGGKNLLDGRFIFFMFVLQLLKIAIMTLVYVFLFYTVFKKSISSRNAPV